ncbi:hypothetical protein NE865_13608 [Phthorimaea operculella]|nr:hypothetical protein NE865_13608 [Phthorimaea operculella]
MKYFIAAAQLHLENFIAQEHLANKLNEEIQRRKEICHFKRKENHKLEAEIKNAEIEVENLRITYKAMRCAHTEMKKELLLTKEKKSEIQERIKNGEKKYEDLWIQCKKKYENIPLVKKLTEDKTKCEELKNDIKILENDAHGLEKAIKDKRHIVKGKDQKQIIQLAEYFVRDLPAAMKSIREKTTMINNLTKEIDDIAKEQEAMKKKANEAKTVKKIPASSEGNDKTENDWAIDASPMMPKLHLPSVDMDVINFKLDINKVTLHTSPVKRTVSFTELEKNTIKKTKPDENLKDNYISCYFNNNAEEDDDTKLRDSPPNYSKKKLINIIEDIKIDDSETYKLMAQANIDQFKDIDVITASKKAKEFIKSANALEIEEIKESDAPNSNNQQELLVPPSQFLDLSQGNIGNNNNDNGQQHDIVNEVVEEMPNISMSQMKNSQECTKKKVSFDIPTQEAHSPDEIVSMSVDNVEDGTPNETATSQLNISDINDENYMAIKDMILKKQNQLDLSPQFVYAKNSLQKRAEETIVTSKFFEAANKNTENTANNQEVNNDKPNTQNEIDENAKGEVGATENNQTEDNIISMDVDNAVSSPKGNDAERPVTGLLFTHGPQGIPDCLDISMSTTGYEEGDADFPTCLDSSLLLSPKADAMPMSGNISETGSQDLPNFLSGFRKGGLSFFKQQPSEPNSDTSKQNQENNFNFNFGSDDKKTKGGLFSFFR